MISTLSDIHIRTTNTYHSSLIILNSLFALYCAVLSGRAEVLASQATYRYKSTTQFSSMVVLSIDLGKFPAKKSYQDFTVLRT